MPREMVQNKNDVPLTAVGLTIQPSIRFDTQYLIQFRTKFEGRNVCIQLHNLLKILESRICHAGLGS